MTDLIDLVENDPRRSAAEKETGITFLGNAEKMRVMSAKKTVVKSLLKHNHFELDWAMAVIDDTTKRVSDPEVEEIDAIYAVSGKMPIGCLTVKSSPRSNNNQSKVVNAETIDPDAFA